MEVGHVDREPGPHTLTAVTTDDAGNQTTQHPYRRPLHEVVSDGPTLRLLIDERRGRRRHAALAALGCELAMLLAVVSAPGGSVVSSRTRSRDRPG